jgi:hypothetical protein
VPRFFFHVRDAADLTDTRGVELPDAGAAERHAVRFAAALLQLGAGGRYAAPPTIAVAGAEGPLFEVALEVRVTAVAAAPAFRFAGAD